MAVRVARVARITRFTQSGPRRAMSRAGATSSTIRNTDDAMLLETTNTAGFPVLSLTVFAPLAGALIVALLPRRHGALCHAIGMFTAGVTLVLSAILLALYDTRWRYIPNRSGFQLADPAGRPAEWLPGGITFQLGVDGIAVVLLALTALLVFVALIFSFGSIRSRSREFVVLMLVLETGMLGVFSALDLFVFYVFWELVLIPMYLLIGVWGGKGRVYATFKFVMYTLAGSALMLVAIVALVAASGSPSFHFFDVASALRTQPLEPWLQAALFGAFCLAFAVKVPLFPFHTWLPYAHVEAPTAGSVILAGVLLKLGAFGFLRYALPLFPDIGRAVVPWAMGIAIVGVWYAAWVAFAQPDMKKLVAYSSVSHLGMVMLGIFALNGVGISGGVLQMVNHGLSTGALFLLVGMLYDRAHTREIDAFGGLWRHMPRFSAAFLVVTFASIGLPGTNGFVGEWLSLLGAFSVRPVYGALGAFGVVLGAAYMLKMYERVFFGPASELSAGMRDLTGREMAALAPLLLLIFWIGLYPETFLEPIRSSATAWVDMIAGTAEFAAR